MSRLDGTDDGYVFRINYKKVRWMIQMINNNNLSQQPQCMDRRD